MKSLVRNYRALLLLTALWLAGCANSPSAVIDFDRTFDFSGVSRVALVPIDRSVSSTTVISDQQAERIAQSIEDELNRRGFDVVTDADEADMLLTWHLVTEEQTNVRTYNAMSARYTTCWDCSPSSSDSVRVTQYTRGTFIIDLIDPGVMQSVWRAVIESVMPDLSAADTAKQAREHAVETALEGFPPG